MYCHKITQYKTYSSVVTSLLSNKIKGNHHEQQSNKPRTHKKGAPECRGIKKMPPQGRGHITLTPLPAARHPRLKAVVSYCKKITADD